MGLHGLLQGYLYLTFESQSGYRGIGIRVPIGPGAHSTYPVGTGGYFPGHEADHSSPASAEVRKMWIYTSAPTYAFMP
jgi:hypothetical protein